MHAQQNIIDDYVPHTCIRNRVDFKQRNLKKKRKNLSNDSNTIYAITLKTTVRNKILNALRQPCRSSGAFFGYMLDHTILST